MEDDPDYHIEVHRRSNHVPISETAIEQAVRAALSAHACRHARLSVAVVDDAEITCLNESYLRHTGPTDVLAFDLDGDLSRSAVDGQIVASAETASREAPSRNVAPDAELLLYIIHGTLHLLGFDDASSPAATAMHQQEDALLTALGYGPVYQCGKHDE